jgi:RNA polymerase sigma factor (sigma-70 family)
MPTVAPSEPATAAPPAADRERMVAGMDNMIYKVYRAFRIPVSDREDFAQDARLALWEATLRFDPAGPAKWSTFATYAIRNVARKFMGQLSDTFNDVEMGGLADPADVPDLDPPPEDDDAVRLADAVRHQLAAPALAALSPGVRKLVEAVVLHRLNLDQIAAQLGQPVKVVKTNLQVALGQLARAGHLTADMGDRLGVNVAKLAGRVDGFRQQRAARERLEKVRELVADGVTEGPAIAERIGCTKVAAYRTLAKLRRPAPDRTRRDWLGPLCVQVAELLPLGLTDAQMADQLGVKAWRVVRARSRINRERDGGNAPYGAGLSTVHSVNFDAVRNVN